MKISFTIYGEPHAQERSGNRISQKFDPTRITGVKQYVQHYDQPTSKEFKDEVRQLAAIEIMRSRQGRMFPIGGREVILHVKAFRSIPSSWPKWKQQQAAQGELRPISKPDLKNYIWGIEDALNDLVYKDDGQIVSFGPAENGKYYTDGDPRTEVTVEFLPLKEKVR